MRDFSILIVIATAIAIGYLEIGKHYDELMVSEKAELRANIMAEKFLTKKRELEALFKLTYETIRTISLFPGVRQISGGNRRSPEEDVIAEGRFKPDAQETIQQLYNNLASNVAVSEVYAVVDGFDHRKGEIPFFMYDSIILDNLKNNLAQAIMDTGEIDDFPEESEEDEYAYYPKQIAYFKQHFPKYNFAELNQIPAVFSPVMRTCDNTQYVSKSHGNLRDANGILYSVPFYSHDTGQLRGIISAILRINILEARLTDLPFLLINDQDKTEADRLKLKRPDVPSAFVLFNEKYGISITDRNNIGIIQAVQRAKRNQDPDLLSAPLHVTTDANWQLDYLIPKAAYAKTKHRVERESLILRGVFLIFGISLMIGIIHKASYLHNY